MRKIEAMMSIDWRGLSFLGIRIRLEMRQFLKIRNLKKGKEFQTGIIVIVMK